MRFHGVSKNLITAIIQGTTQHLQDKRQQKKILVVFHNVSIYDYRFIIEQLVKEFQGQFNCLRENTEEYITFSVPVERQKQVEVHKIQNKIHLQGKIYG